MQYSGNNEGRSRDLGIMVGGYNKSSKISGNDDLIVSGGGTTTTPGGYYSNR